MIDGGVKLLEEQEGMEEYLSFVFGCGNYNRCFDRLIVLKMSFKNNIKATVLLQTNKQIKTYFVLILII